MKEGYKIVSSKLELELQKNKTLKIGADTHRELVRLGGKNDSFDDIIMRLIKEHYEKNKK